MHSFIHSFIRPKRKRGGHAETVYSRPRRGAKFFALTSVILPPPLPRAMYLSFSFPLRFFLSTRLLSRGRGAFSFPAFFNRRKFGIAKRRGEGRGKVNLSRRVSRYLVLSRECWRTLDSAETSAREI